MVQKLLQLIIKMVSSEILNFIYVTIFSVFFLYINNKYNKNVKAVQAFNFLVLSESIVLTFFFAKFPSYLSLLICLNSIYYILLKSEENSIFSDHKLSTIFPEKIVSAFKYLGLVLILCVLIYEYFADGAFSEADLLVLSLSFLLIFFEQIPEDYKTERDFFVLFLFLLSFLFVLPMVIYKIKYGYVGAKTEGFWYDSAFFTYHLLSRPLYFFLSILGYNVAIDGPLLSYEDLVAQRLQTVHISESCAGINSIKIIISALFSYSAVEYRKFDYNFALVIFWGCLIAYIANLFRMVIIVLSGHYKGIDFMLFVHQHVGWVIFTFWVFLFWNILDNYYRSIKIQERYM